MDIVFVYSPEQVTAAAEFVFKHNKSIYKDYGPSTSDRIVHNIKTTVRKLARENVNILLKERKLKIQTNDWNNYSGTMGFTVLMSLVADGAEEITLSIDVLVDPALGTVKQYVTEAFDSVLLLK